MKMVNSENVLVALVIISFTLTAAEVIIIQNPQSSDIILSWIDVEAETTGPSEFWFPRDPTYWEVDINWRLITFDPDIERNHQFWCLCEIEISKVSEISEIPWVNNIILIKTGGYERVYKIPKLWGKGSEYAVQRAIYEGNKPLEVAVYMKSTKPHETRDFMIADLTTFINRIGGEVLKISPYGCKLLARIPANYMQAVTDIAFVEEIYLNGPVLG